MPKKNFNKVPQRVTDKISGLKGDLIQVATVVRVSLDDIKGGLYDYLGVSVSGDRVTTGQGIVPPVDKGRFSKRNQEGKETTRKDLPKVNKSIYLGPRPIYGDWSNGSFELYQNRKVYRKEYQEPKGYSIESEVLEQSQNGSDPAIKFAIIPVLDKSSSSFDDDLLYQINILQENIGSVDVFSSSVTRSELLKQVVIDWEILPPGESDEIIRRATESIRNPSDDDRRRIIDRKDFLEHLNPKDYVLGLSGNRRYFGARFSDQLVVFENVEYGNAVYIMYDNWEELSKRSRTELMQLDDSVFDRVVHRDGWKGHVEHIVNKRLGRRRKRRY